MNIAATQNVNFEGSIYDKFFKHLPNKDIKNPKAFNRLGYMLASPHWNRLAVGTAAIITQPATDYYNPKVDKDTAKASMYRTLAKIIACTSVGFTVRGICYKLTEKYAHASASQGSTLLTPQVILREKCPKLRESMLKIHKNGLSTLLALIMMAFTNILLDAPLTTLLANKFISSDKTLNQKKNLEAVK